MLPKSNYDISEVEVKNNPSNTYKMNINDEIIKGKTDYIEAVKQAVYKALNTERYDYPIYSWNYGVELKDLFGMSRDYAISELPRRITEALITDDRIIAVEDFQFSYKKGAVAVTFKVITTMGEFTARKEVNI